MKSDPGISIVIPALDEAEALPGLLQDLACQADISLDILVVDGGSRDRTPDIAIAAGARLLTTEPGRARQMNAGAAAAVYSCLLFLHADCRLDGPCQLRRGLNAWAAREAVSSAPVVGHFKLGFIESDVRKRFLFRYMTEKTATGRRYTINGDQGLMLDRTRFDALGGFDTQTGFLEDQRMIAALQNTGATIIRLPGTLWTSARRFTAEGPKRRYALMALIMAMYINRVSLFFEAAPRVYVRQRQAERLVLWPYIALVGALCRRCGLRRMLRMIWRTATLVVSQAWQLIFALDVWRARGMSVDARWTQVYERYGARWVENPLSIGCIAIVLSLGLVGAIVMDAVCCASRSADRERL